MLKLKHTRGKWRIIDFARTAINSGTKHIAMISYFHSGDPSRDVYGEEHDANVRLILASPEMLRAIMNHCKSCPCNRPPVNRKKTCSKCSFKKVVEKIANMKLTTAIG